MALIHTLVRIRGGNFFKSMQKGGLWSIVCKRLASLNGKTLFWGMCICVCVCVCVCSHMQEAHISQWELSLSLSHTVSNLCVVHARV
jgi:hypothetical protein